MFQFHSGSIKRCAAIVREGIKQGCFNSIVVRLKGVESFAPKPFFHSFNSIVVRLKGKRQALQIINHNSFNSIVVRLKEIIFSGFNAGRESFNSIVVRLKDAYKGLVKPNNERFQFHSGSIKSESVKPNKSSIITVSIP